MICSIPTVKSGSTWLDRLRSTKGFPTADGLDLGHFLLSSNNNNQNSNPESDPNPNPDSPESTQSDDKRAVVDNGKQNSTGRNVAAEDGGGGGESEWFGIMSNVLADLFNMNNGGEVDRKRRKKSLRKQRNPRICLVPTAAAAEAVEEEEERSSGGCERKDENALAENNNVVDREEEEEEKEEEEESGGGERELLGFSRNEVTVIDTSCMEWKFEKLVYRKRNVWKVREKKGKSKFVGRKRRKGGAGSEDGKKKMKVSNENVGGGGGGVPPLKNVSLLVMMLMIDMFSRWKKLISYVLDCLFGYVRCLDCHRVLKWCDL